MAEYHVGCGFAGIYAGTLKKNGNEWLHKGETSMAYAVKMNNGKYVRLKIEVSDECPGWAKEQLGEE